MVHSCWCICIFVMSGFGLNSKCFKVSLKMIQNNFKIKEMEKAFPLSYSGPEEPARPVLPQAHLLLPRLGQSAAGPAWPLPLPSEPLGPVGIGRPGRRPRPTRSHIPAPLPQAQFASRPSSEAMFSFSLYTTDEVAPRVSAIPFLVSVPMWDSIPC